MDVQVGGIWVWRMSRWDCGCGGCPGGIVDVKDVQVGM